MFRISRGIVLASLTASLLGSALGCGGDDSSTEPDRKTVPVMTTAAVSEITATAARCGGNVTSDGGAAVSARGVCWSADPIPTASDSTTTDGSGSGSFTSALTGLTPDTPYYVRAYATNTVGTGYGDIRPFQTESSAGDSTGTVTDIDGNVYPTVKIGNQWWMAADLRVTHYRDGGKCPTIAPDARPRMAGNPRETRSPAGEPIPNVTDGYAWSILTSGAFCYYNNDENNADVYGCLYNWYAVADSREIAPLGWHVPSNAEWQTLIAFLGGEDAAAGELKEAGTAHWTAPNTGATNGSGFTALPGGYRVISGIFRNIGNNALIWSSTEDNTNTGFAWYISLHYNSAGLYNFSDGKNIGMSVRCIRD